jgi:hypothetical protein
LGAGARSGRQGRAQRGPQGLALDGREHGGTLWATGAERGMASACASRRLRCAATPTWNAKDLAGVSALAERASMAG